MSILSYLFQIHVAYTSYAIFFLLSYFSVNYLEVKIGSKQHLLFPKQHYSTRV